MKSFKEYTAANEALNMAQRQKRKAAFRKNKAKIMIARKKASKKLASPEKLKARAQKAARQLIIKKILKNKGKDDLSFAARQELEKKVDKKKSAINRIAKKLLPQVKKNDRAKLSRHKTQTPGQTRDD
jgi:protein subunit release factor A